MPSPSWTKRLYEPLFAQLVSATWSSWWPPLYWWYYVDMFHSMEPRTGHVITTWKESCLPSAWWLHATWCAFGLFHCNNTMLIQWFSSSRTRRRCEIMCSQASSPISICLNLEAQCLKSIQKYLSLIRVVMDIQYKYILHHLISVMFLTSISSCVWKFYSLIKSCIEKHFLLSVLNFPF